MEDTFVGYQLLEHHIFLFNSGGTPRSLHIWDLAEYDRWRGLIWERICEDLVEKVCVSSNLTIIPIIVKEHLAQSPTHSLTFSISPFLPIRFYLLSLSINPWNKLSINLTFTHSFMHNIIFFFYVSLFNNFNDLRILPMHVCHNL